MPTELDHRLGRSLNPIRITKQPVPQLHTEKRPLAPASFPPAAQGRQSMKVHDGDSWITVAVTVPPPPPPPIVQFPTPIRDPLAEACNNPSTWGLPVPKKGVKNWAANTKQLKDAIATGKSLFDAEEDLDDPGAALFLNNVAAGFCVADAYSPVPYAVKAYIEGAAIGYVLAADGLASWRYLPYYVTYIGNPYDRSADRQFWQLVQNKYTRGLHAGGIKGMAIAYKTAVREALFNWLNYQLRKRTHFGSTKGLRFAAWRTDRTANAAGIAPDPGEKLEFYYRMCAKMFRQRIRLF